MEIQSEFEGQTDRVTERQSRRMVCPGKVHPKSSFALLRVSLGPIWAALPAGENGLKPLERWMEFAGLPTGG